jgi:hypothetical protein
MSNDIIVSFHRLIQTAQIAQTAQTAVGKKFVALKDPEDKMMQCRIAGPEMETRDRNKR